MVGKIMNELNVGTENNPKQKKSGGKTVRMKETLKEELSKCFFKGLRNNLFALVFIFKSIRIIKTIPVLSLYSFNKG